jgi:hypothetical protein
VAELHLTADAYVRLEGRDSTFSIPAALPEQRHFAPKRYRRGSEGDCKSRIGTTRGGEPREERSGLFQAMATSAARRRNSGFSPLLSHKIPLLAKSGNFGRNSLI